MAWIKKRGARKQLDSGTPSPSISNWPEDGGLRFNMEIGDHKVSLSHVERDAIIASWAKLEKEFETGAIDGNYILDSLARKR